MPRKKKVRWIEHYNSSQKILLVGEGDFSFSACLARAFRSGANMIATSLYTKGVLKVKHWSSEEHLKELKSLGCQVLHRVDVHKMKKHPNLKGEKFDRIIFNFPHAGHFEGLCERDTVLIEMHKELVEGFFKCAKEMVCEGGEVHIIHRDDYPYHLWEVENLAAKAGLRLKEKAEFVKSNYPGYHNKRGGDINSNKTFPVGYSFTFKFTLQTTTMATISNNINEYNDEEEASAMSSIVAGVSHLHL